ncbi:MAG TPA: hypothetical protein VJS92_10035 [Candidatus Polarisedimenticolaceae bacterium]|nr:hypothetical protein [Candidatus Polarisedimenticolaceae bacterium]
MLKRAVRGTVNTLRRWLQDEPAPSAPANFDRDETLYPWLNAQFLKIAGDGLRRRDYAWGVLQGAHLATVLGLPRISVIEFGVAGGRSLVELERIAESTERLFSVKIDVIGFDRGEGLPKPQDHRDAPNLAVEGFFRMDQAKLRARLKRSQLVLGSLEATIPQFVAARPAPVAFCAVDLVLYSSTVHALKLLEADAALLLPRVHCYFDDVFGFTMGDCNGERLAITEFNAAHPRRQLSPIYGLKYFVPERWAQSQWVEKFWMAHLFDHPQYGQYDGLVKRGTLDLDQWD